MKTRLIFLVLLIVCFSCGTNNKPLSDAQKEKIKGEVKEVVNIIIKSAEQSNFNMASAIWLDSPDFVYINNGKSSDYKEFAEFSKSHFSKANLKCTIKDENYVFLDRSNVLYTTSCTWTSKFKDGYSILADPWTMSLLIREIGSKWKVTYFSESGVEKSIKDSEPSKEHNQIELMKQFIGTWKCEIGKDTTYFWEAKSYGTGLECYSRYVTKGRVFKEGKDLYGYDKNIDKFIDAELIKGKDIEITVTWFTSNKNTEEILYSNNTNSDIEKMVGEFKSPDMFVETYTVNNKPVKTWTYTRIK